MANPICDRRITIMRLVTDLLHHAHRWWFPELKFSKAVAMTVIVNEIVIAEVEGKPYTVARLARRFQVTRPNMTTRIRYLVRKGLLTRDGQRIEFNHAAVQTAQAEESLKLAMQIVMLANDTITKKID